VKLGEARDHEAAVARRERLEMEALRFAPAERRRPYDHPALLELAARAEHALRTAADQRARAEPCLDRRDAVLDAAQIGAAREHRNEVGGCAAESQLRAARGLGEGVDAGGGRHEPRGNAHRRHGRAGPSFRPT
jgi:hypothetical protein